MRYSQSHTKEITGAECFVQEVITQFLLGESFFKKIFFIFLLFQSELMTLRTQEQLTPQTQG